MTAWWAQAQPTPNSRATSATVSSSSPTRRQISRRARSVSDARGAMCGDVSDHEPRATLRLSRQRQSALRPHQHRRCPGDRQVPHQHPTAAVAIARTPQSGHHARSVVVSTASQCSPSRYTCAGDGEPSMPTSATRSTRRRYRSPRRRPPVCRCRQSAEWRGLRLRVVDPEAGTLTTRPQRSTRRAR